MSTLWYAVIMPSPSASSLLDQLAPALDPAAHAWLTRTLADSALLGHRLRLRTAFTQVPRKLGRTADVVAPAQPHAPTQLDLARAALLLRALEVVPESEHVDLLEELYRTGEQREQQSLLRALPQLPDAARFTDLAVNACRTNSLAVFGAIASENAFPATYFSEPSFNQLVLKSIFLAVPVAHITGLASRANAELRRMLDEYASERLAASRPVPDDVRHALALCPPLAHGAAPTDER